MTIRSRAAGYLRDARSGFQRAPVEVLVTFVVALAFTVAVEAGGDAMQAWAEFAVPCFLMLVAAWTGTLLHAMGAIDLRRRWTITLAGVGLAALYAFLFADFEYEAEAWRAVLLCGGAVMWLLALPGFGGGRAGRVERMRGIDGRILLRLIGAVLYGGALFAGLALALAAVNSLFELHLDGEIYGQVFGWIFFALVPWIALGGLADYVRPLDQTNAVAGVAQRIALYLVPPLLAVYYVILLAYVARILITGEVPKNLVSPMVLAAGGLSALGLLLFDPRPDEKGLARWLRITPALFLPVSALGFWALAQRTDQYGLTEFRVVRFAVLVTLTLLALGGTAWLARRRLLPLHAIPLALGAVALLCAIGPWSALALSRRSQQARLLDALAAAGIEPGDTAYVAPPDSAQRVVPGAAYEGIRGSAQYLAQHFGARSLPPVLERYARGDDARWAEYPMLLGLRPDSVAATERYARGGTLEFNVPVRTAGGTAYRVQWPTSPGRIGPEPVATPGLQTTIADSARIVLRIGDRPLRADLSGVAAAMPQGPGRPLLIAPERAVVQLVDSTGAPAGELIVWNLWLQPDSAGAYTISSLEGLAVVP